MIGAGDHLAGDIGNRGIVRSGQICERFGGDVFLLRCERVGCAFTPAAVNRVFRKGAKGQGQKHQRSEDKGRYFFHHHDFLLSFSRITERFFSVHPNRRMRRKNCSAPFQVFSGERKSERNRLARPVFRRYTSVWRYRTCLGAPAGTLQVFVCAKRSLPGDQSAAESVWKPVPQTEQALQKLLGKKGRP